LRDLSRFFVPHFSLRRHGSTANRRICDFDKKKQRRRVPADKEVGNRRTTGYLEVTDCDLKFEGAPMSGNELTTIDVRVADSIYLIRGNQVVLDADLARMYGVETKALNQAVKRRQERFPKDFMFQLSSEEFEILKNQTPSSTTWGGRRYPPYAFTELGVAMLSSVLNSTRAIQVNIAIMRTFVRLRQLLASDEKLARKLREMERRYDNQFRVVFDAIRQLSSPPASTSRRIGFGVTDE
jgi:hypothetical protein